MNGDGDVDEGRVIENKLTLVYSTDACGGSLAGGGAVLTGQPPGYHCPLAANQCCVPVVDDMSRCICISSSPR